jgi:methylase of polypeptide subunit release factors
MRGERVARRVDTILRTNVLEEKPRLIDHYSLVQRLTGQLPSVDQSRRLNDFVFELGWRPSDHLDIPGSNDFATAHLIVEHGLEYSALISFLRHPSKFIDLDASQQRVLVGASYNSLVDWHINVDYEGVAFVYNRYRPPDFHIVRESLSRANASSLRRTAFQRIATSHPSPDVPTLDRAIIQTISLWKRQLGGAIPGISNTSLSALFNAIIFVRAAEDHKRQLGHPLHESGLLSHLAYSDEAAPLSMRRLIEVALEQLALTNVPNNLIDLESLTTFQSLELGLLQELVSDFYRNRFARFYEYDFSLISKHALSRIYEHYVSILRIPDTDQLSLLPRLAVEELDKSFGAVYTPEYIARFFARYIRNRLPLAAFQRLRVLDPACGSGIFLRAFLELQNEALLEARTTESVAATFDNVLGVDIDANACQAARLSLSLLSLVLLDDDIRDVNIQNENALTYIPEHGADLRVDVVVANPPYVKVESQSQEVRDAILNILGETSQGRPDLYLAVLKLAIESLSPGGYGLFVLPETFLKSDSARGVRQFLAATCWVHCVVDLTAVRVFEDTGVYTILLIFQKQLPSDTEPIAKILLCQDRVAQALQEVLDNRVTQTSFYSLHESTQDAFAQEEWTLATPAVALVLRKYAEVGELSEEAQLRQGMNTGADDVFLLPSQALQQVDPELFVPLLSDREMEAFTVPTTVQSYAFYPYVNEQLLTEEYLHDKFPRTWAFLESHRQILEQRSGVKKGQLLWWRPERPRDPKNLLRQKIVTPHVVIAPKFGLDLTGQYAVSRAPLIFSKRGEQGGRDHLLYLLAILNSAPCFWHIARRAHTYERGYSRLEIARLRGTRIPRFKAVDKGAARRLIRAAEARLHSHGKAAFELEDEIDDIVGDLYNLSPSERNLIAGGPHDGYALSN